MNLPSPDPESRWTDRLTRSKYFFGALLLHLVAFMLVATWIIWPAQPSTVVELITPHKPDGPIEPPTPPQPPIDPTDLTKLDSGVNIPVIVTLRNDNPVNLPKFEPGAGNLGQNPGEHKIINEPGLKPSKGPGILPRLNDIRKMQKGFGRTEKEIATGDTTCTFPVYVASYANGDWDCNTRLDAEGNIVAGGIPDLVAKISEWSKGKMKGQLVPQPLKIGSPELLDKMPAFIFFTGHKDFVLTQAEIDNLQAYLLRGGAVWGDNALPGQGSRFDVAFKREMKRVIPDEDKQFTTYDLNSDIFAKGQTSITEVPSGMNYYTELPQHLDIDNKLAVLYTPNDYSDLLFMRVLPGDKDVYLPHIVPPNTLYTNRTFWDRRGVYYRNFNLESSLAAHRFGMNIVVHLITRFDDVLLMNQ